ncbi:MAG: riboflavin biosynthesis protein RibD [Pelagibacterium sp. SCN 63-23]|nr:MAG: riboflavin biosynthesis protein RibD [Pelagibacterium sp. SCN 63-23]
MGRLLFGMMTSLDGYINDIHGGFDWGQVSEEVHRFAEAEEARTGTMIYGRRMFETMKVWDGLEDDDGVSQVERDYAALWRRLDKIVVSSTLPEVTTVRTTLMRDLSGEDVVRLKAGSEKDISVSGATLGSSLLRQGLVDEVGLYLIPVAVGQGTPMFQVGELTRFERKQVRAFENGVVFMRFGVVH